MQIFRLQSRRFLLEMSERLDSVDDRTSRSAVACNACRTKKQKVSKLSVNCLGSDYQMFPKAYCIFLECGGEKLGSRHHNLNRQF